MSGEGGTAEGPVPPTPGGSGPRGDLGRCRSIFCHSCQSERLCLVPLDSGEGREEGGGQRQLACPICGSEFVEELEPAPTLRAFPDPATSPTRASALSPVPVPQAGVAGPGSAASGSAQTTSSVPLGGPSRFSVVHHPISVRVETRGHFTPQLLESFLSLGLPVGTAEGGTGETFGGSLGDYVFHNEALERVLAQLAENHAVVSQPAAAEEVAKLPRIRSVSGLRKATSEKCCSICQEDFCGAGEEGDGVCRAAIKMPCSHVFHEDCLLQWLKEQNTCPICRMSLPTSEGGEGEGQAARPGGSGEATTLGTPTTQGALGSEHESTEAEIDLEVLREMNDIDEDPRPGVNRIALDEAEGAGLSGDPGEGERSKSLWAKTRFLMKTLAPLGTMIKSLPLMKWVARPLGRAFHFLSGGRRSRGGSSRSSS